MNDPIVEEIHEIRRRIFEECGNDLGRLLEHFKAAEVKDTDRLVSYEQVQQASQEAKSGT
jgi:hypothetical protein